VQRAVPETEPGVIAVPFHQKSHPVVQLRGDHAAHLLDAMADDPQVFRQLGRQYPPEFFLEGINRPVFHALDRKSTRLNSSHVKISYAVFCLKKKRLTQRLSNLKIS